ncbi:hypothetical protein ILUMI_24120 [Ignelater luminosus]|uniref:Uncharacterized protein n=1 Tax=Ignelater luminosus TaxID=2038154 RepID=A0A8K0CE24_IGNLU|nr:hypothetical protein ILUMI_24120 [Ignelater luminosus]
MSTAKRFYLSILIWNCDETALTAVHNPQKVLVEKELKNLDIIGHSTPANSLINGHQSGWMTSENFLKHENHVSLEIIIAAKDAPHASHRLQLLDVSVYGPLNNFLMSSVTDQPFPDKVFADSATHTDRPMTPGPSSQLVFPKTVVPYPKAVPRELAKGGREPERTRILTDTPEKDEVEQRVKKRVKFNIIPNKNENISKAIASQSDSFEVDKSSNSDFDPEEPEKDFDSSGEKVAC